MLRVHLLGRFVLYTPSGEILLPSHKVRQLAAYLLWRFGIPVRRELLLLIEAPNAHGRHRADVT